MKCNIFPPFIVLLDINAMIGELIMKTWKTTLATGLISLSLFGCQAQEPPTPPPTPVAAVPETTPEPGVPAAKKPSETKVYQNSVDAYLMDLPPEWSDVQIIEEGRSTDFLFPSKKSDTRQSLMRIVGMTNEEWEKVKTEGGPAVAQLKEIAAFGDSRYFYVLPLDQVHLENRFVMALGCLERE